jgi:hypothetical protein
MWWLGAAVVTRGGSKSGESDALERLVRLG